LLFQRQHQFEFIDGGVLVFDNGLVSESHSQVIEIALDTGAWTADLASTYESDPSLYSMVLGDVARLPNGNDLVAWSTAGVVEEATPDGEVVWKLQTQLGGGIGYVTWRRTLYSRGAGEEE